MSSAWSHLPQSNGNKKERKFLDVSGNLKKEGLHLIPLDLNLILIRSVHNRTNRQSHKPHTLTRVFPAPLSASVGHRTQPMTGCAVEPWALEMEKPHWDTAPATCPSPKGSPASGRTRDHNPSNPFLPHFLSFKGKGFPLLNWNTAQIPHQAWI